MMQKLVADIGMHYGGDAQTFILGDGVTPPTVGSAVSVAMEHVKERKFGGLWSHRYLDFYLKNSIAQYVMRIDPDTQVLRKAENLPATDCVFCRIWHYTIGKKECRFPHGGAHGFTRGMAERIVNGKYFLDPYYCNSARFHHTNDRMLEDIMSKRCLPYEDRTDFDIWQGTNPIRGATFFHPVK